MEFGLNSLTRSLSRTEEDSYSITKIVSLILAFSITPFACQLYLVTRSTGFIIFVLLVIIQTLLIFYIYKMLISHCKESSSKNFIELLNNYLDIKFAYAASIEVIYFLGVLILIQVLLKRDAELLIENLFSMMDAKKELVSQIGLIKLCLMLFFNSLAFLLSLRRSINDFFKLFFVSLGIMIFFIFGILGDIIARNGRISEFKLLPNFIELSIEDTHEYISVFESVFYLIAITNSLQSAMIMYQELHNQGVASSKDQLLSSINISRNLALVFYIIFGFMIYLDYLITSNKSSEVHFNDHKNFSFSTFLQIGYRFVLSSMLIFQLAINILPMKQSLSYIYYGEKSDISLGKEILLIWVILCCSGAVCFLRVTINAAYIMAGVVNLLFGILPSAMIVYQESKIYGKLVLLYGSLQLIAMVCYFIFLIF